MWISPQTASTLRGLTMGNSAIASSNTLIAGILSGLLAFGASVEAQVQDLAWTTPPTLGEAIKSDGASQAELAGNPLPEGMSFQAVGDLIKTPASQNKRVLRGAREIGIYRQAAPAVVLLKTKDGRGSGVVLENGLVVTNRHVVEGVGFVEMFFKPTDLTQVTSSIEVGMAVDRPRLTGAASVAGYLSDMRVSPSRSPGSGRANLQREAAALGLKLSVN